MALVPPHIRRLPGRPGTLADRVWMKAARAVRPLRKRIAHQQFVRVPDGTRLVLDPLEIPPLAELPDALAGPAREVIQEAEAVLEHRMRFVSAEYHQYGDPIEWSVDPVTGYEWPGAWFGSLDFGRPDAGRDVIRVWELSRGHQLLTLARASRLAPERAGEYLAECAAQLDDWIEANPVGHSVNWGNAMEAAIRAVNWVQAVRTAGPDRLPPETLSRATRSLQQHGRFIRSSLEGTPWRRGNHYIADLMGLAVLGGALDGDPEAKGWSKAARRLLEREVGIQIYDDGLSFESSSGYQGLVLEMAAIAIAALARAGQEVDPATRARVASMIGASVAIRHPDGRAAQFGDSDSGRILPGGFSREPSLDPVIWMAAAILGQGPPLPGAPDPEVAWNLGLDRWQEIGRAPEPPGSHRVSFPDGGIEVLEGSDGKVVVNCTPTGKRGNGGHAHSDALSFEWSVNGHTLVVDPGTYCYTESSADRNLMRSTASHPTPMIDGQEINPLIPGRTFALTATGDPFVLDRSTRPSGSRLRVGHPGYERLEEPVSVRREFELDSDGMELSVTDQVGGAGRHSWEIPLPLAPGWTLELKGETSAVALGPAGSVDFEFRGPGRLGAEEYWYSPGYGVRERAERLVMRGSGDLPVEISMRARAG